MFTLASQGPTTMAAHLNVASSGLFEVEVNQQPSANGDLMHGFCSFTSLEAPDHHTIIIIIITIIIIKIHVPQPTILEPF